MVTKEQKTIEVKPQIGQATEEQISKWKKENKLGVYFIVVDDKVGYFKRPNRLEINRALSVAKGDMPMASVEEMANLTWLGGCEELLTDDLYYLNVMNGVKQVLEGYNALVGNL